MPRTYKKKRGRGRPKGSKNRKTREAAPSNQKEAFGELVKNKYSKEVVFEAFLLARSGMKDTKIAKAIGITYPTYIKWRETKEWFTKAIDHGRAARAKPEGSTFQEHMLSTMPDDIREVWDSIEAYGGDGNALRRIEGMLADRGDGFRQQLFLHGLVACNFNTTEACRRTMVSKPVLKRWCREKDFCQLLEYVNEAKKDFFESALVDLVANGDSPATVFANKTYNRDRGYNEKQQIEISGSVQHNHNVVNIGDLGLSVELRRELLDAIREKKALEAPNVGGTGDRSKETALAVRI